MKQGKAQGRGEVAGLLEVYGLEYDDSGESATSRRRDGGCFFRRRDRGNEKVGKTVPARRGRRNDRRCLLCCSDRLVCIRCRATPPFSSVAKSNPRFGDCRPVDMSVRLPAAKTLLYGRRALVGLRLREGRTEMGPLGLSLVKSWSGSYLWRYRILSRSDGRKMCMYAFHKKRGSSARTTVSKIPNQKYADLQR